MEAVKIVSENDELIDFTLIDEYVEMSQQMGKNVLSGLIGTFEEQFPQYMDRLKNAIENGEREEISKCAHVLKGASLSVGIKKMSGIFSQLEEKPEVDDMESFLKEIYARKTESMDVIGKYLKHQMPAL